MTHLIRRLALILLASVALPTYAGANTATDAPGVVGVDAAARANSSARTYTVRRGDTLAKVALKLDSDIEELARINGLRKPYRLSPGQVLKGPGAVVKATVRTTTSRASTQTYVVQRGDTLFAIAGRLGTTVEALRAANGLGRSSALMPGRKLRVSGEAPEADADEIASRPAPTVRTVRRTPAEPETSTGDRAVTGRVVNVETPGKAYRVKKGDTLERIARRMGSEIDDLARINKLKRPYRLQPGQTIRGPGDTAKAYVVARGDTLAEIAQRFGVSVDKLRATNGLRRGAAVAPGRKLRLPAGYRDRGPITVARPGPEPRESPVPREVEPREPVTPPPVAVETPQPSEALPSRPQPYRPPARPPRPPTQTFTPQGAVNGAPTASPPVSDAEITQMGRGVFVWPLQGEVLSGFGSKGQGQRNDGVNIRARLGDPVRAAAAGDVVYAGDQVPGFGNLVLVKHADGWVTAYGHLSRVGVRMQQKVSQGQEVGQAGSSGGVSEPQLHFEVRFAPTPQERARPVDPALVLPR